MTPTHDRRLAEALQTLSRREAELDACRRQIADLQAEIEQTNQGLIALHAELEAAKEAEATARAKQRVLADRERIARDLHDMIIQRVFAAGLSLQGTAVLVDDPQATKRLQAVISELDVTIEELRTAIFDLNRPQQATSMRAQLLEVTSRATEPLGFAPVVRFDGPVDAAVPDDVAVHLLAVVREALSNVIRHADASAVEVTLSAGSELVVQVVDDGRGLGQRSRSSGLDSLRERARTLGGTLELSSPPGAGTRLQWRIPLPWKGDAPS